jgi:hypothetical protein
VTRLGMAGESSGVGFASGGHGDGLVSPACPWLPKGRAISAFWPEAQHRLDAGLSGLASCHGLMEVARRGCFTPGRVLIAGLRDRANASLRPVPLEQIPPIPAFSK